MSTAVSVRLPEQPAIEIDEIAQATERAGSFHQTRRILDKIEETLSEQAETFPALTGSSPGYGNFVWEITV